MLDFLFELPLWIAGPLIVGSLCLYALIGLGFARRRILPRLRIHAEDSDFSAGVLGGVMIFYSLAVALIAINVWETYSDVSKIISQEATSLAALYRDVGEYPEPKGSQLQKQLRDYTEQVIHEAWPIQARGKVPAGGVQIMDSFQSALAGFEPSTDGQRILHAETLHAYNELILARRLRLDAVGTQLPGILWIIIIMGGLIAISSSFFFKVEDGRLHGIQVVFLATLIGMIILVVVAFDYPFRGDLALRPDPYQLVYDHLMNP